MMPQAFSVAGFVNAVEELLNKIETPAFKINFNAEGDFNEHQ
jgi:hypothetical protein